MCSSRCETSSEPEFNCEETECSCSDVTLIAPIAHSSCLFDERTASGGSDIPNQECAPPAVSMVSAEILTSRPEHSMAGVARRVAQEEACVPLVVGATLAEDLRHPSP